MASLLTSIITRISKSENRARSAFAGKFARNRATAAINSASLATSPTMVSSRCKRSKSTNIKPGNSSLTCVSRLSGVACASSLSCNCANAAARFINPVCASIWVRLVSSSCSILIAVISWQVPTTRQSLPFKSFGLPEMRIQTVLLLAVTKRISLCIGCGLACMLSHQGISRWRSTGCTHANASAISIAATGCCSSI